MGQKSHKGHTIHDCSYSQFIDTTKAALDRYNQGKATKDDVAQIGYAAEKGRGIVSQWGYPGYPHVYAEQENLMVQCEGVVENAQLDAEEKGEDNEFVGWTLYYNWS